jgi:dCMP deaminase
VYGDVATALARRGDCRRRRIGAVIVLDDAPVSWGYNGTGPGAPGCIDGACPRGLTDVPAYGSYDECIARHAEVNAIGFAARRGVATAGATIYVTAEPCHGCAKAISAAGIARVVVVDNTVAN